MHLPRVGLAYAGLIVRYGMHAVALLRVCMAKPWLATSHEAQNCNRRQPSRLAVVVTESADRRLAIMNLVKLVHFMTKLQKFSQKQLDIRNINILLFIVLIIHYIYTLYLIFSKNFKVDIPLTSPLNRTISNEYSKSQHLHHLLNNCRHPKEKY